LNFRAEGQQLNSNPNNITPITSPATVQLSPPASPVSAATIDMQLLDNAEVSYPALGEVSPVARTSGVSTPSGTTAPVFENRSYIANVVTPNPFQPPDLITANGPVVLTSLHLNQPWSISFGIGSSLNYDSNITRNSGATHLDDGYIHTAAGFDFRLGTKTDAVALDLAYNYTADLFDRYSQFDTYTHNLSFSSRIGRSSFVLVPYVVGRFRSVESQNADDSGRQSYDFLQGGAQGENSYFPDLVHVYNFSYTTVSYPAQKNSDFGIWDLAQQLNYNFNNQPDRGYLQDVQVFPWVELRRTVPEGLEPVDEVSGGVGGSATLVQNLSVRAKVGWGNVSSDDPAINYSSYSGFRYNASLVYRPLRYIVLSSQFQRTLSFNPQVRSRYIDQINTSLAFPFSIGPYLTLTPAFAFYHAVSLDYTDSNDQSNYLQPSFTVAYKFDDHFAIFGKFEYSDNISTQLDVNQLGVNQPGNSQNQSTHDVQGSAGFTSLF
jgi:hypothetical protein